MENEDYTLLIAVEAILENNMRMIHGQKVLLLEEMANLYQVTPMELHRTVQQNRKRFPKDFMLTLTHYDRRLYKTNYAQAFTRMGVFMAGGLLQSPKAVQVHIQVIRSMTSICELDELLPDD